MCATSEREYPNPQRSTTLGVVLSDPFAFFYEDPQSWLLRWDVQVEVGGEVEEYRDVTLRVSSGQAELWGFEPSGPPEAYVETDEPNAQLDQMIVESINITDKGVVLRGQTATAGEPDPDGVPRMPEGLMATEWRAVPYRVQA